MNFKPGKITKEQYTEAAIWCNSHNCHIEKQGDEYFIVENAPLPEPTLEQVVAGLEAQTGLIRPMRELILAENSGASDYAKSKAQEIEHLAEQLRH